MKPLNYLRRAKEYFEENFDFTKTAPEDHKLIKDALRVADKSVKFILPNGGRLIESDLSHIPDTLRLPYPSVVLEYEMKGFDGNGIVDRMFGDKVFKSSKRVCIAQELDEKIFVSSLVYLDNTGWIFSPYTAIISIQKDDSKLHSDFPIDPNTKRIQGLGVQIIPFKTLQLLEMSFEEASRTGYADMMDEVLTVCAFIEIMACTNVTTESVPTQKMNKGAIKRGALPFDEYKILTLRTSKGEGKAHSFDHRSPREHLRRGHIRKIYLTGKTVWVNSCVVNAGIGGKVTKDYALA